MKHDERTFHIYDLEIAARKDGACLPSMEQVIAVWDGLRIKNQVYPIFSGDKKMLIGDLSIKEEDKIVIILIRLSDTKAPNSVYSDPDQSLFAEHPKGDDVGADYCCHVFISLQPEIQHPNVYTCAIERVNGLAAGLVQRILSKFLNYEYKNNQAFFSYPSPGGGNDKDGNPRTDRCCPHVELRGRPSDAMINDINSGRLSGVSLIKSEPVTPISGASYLKKTTSELKLEIDHKNLPANLWSSLTKMVKSNSDTYGTAKIAYRIPNSSRRVTIEIDSETATPMSELYTQSFDIKGVFPPLAQSSKVIVKRLTDPATIEFVKHRSI